MQLDDFCSICLLTAIAEFETEIRSERQLHGIHNCGELDPQARKSHSASPLIRQEFLNLGIVEVY